MPFKIFVFLEIFLYTFFILMIWLGNVCNISVSYIFYSAEWKWRWVRSKVFHFEVPSKSTALNPASTLFPLLISDRIITKGIHSKPSDLQAEIKWWSRTIKNSPVSSIYPAICLHLSRTLPVPLLIGGGRLRNEGRREGIKYSWLITNWIEIILMRILRRKLDSMDREIRVILRIFTLKELRIQRASITNK